jgi:hypothetical protein
MVDGRVNRKRGSEASWGGEMGYGRRNCYSGKQKMLARLAWQTEGDRVNCKQFGRWPAHRAEAIQVRCGALV